MKSEKRVFLGTTDDKRLVFVVVRREPADKPVTFTDHTTGTCARLSITFEVGTDRELRRGDGSYGCGTEWSAKAVAVRAPGAPDPVRVAEIADRWHLNDMHAACAHQKGYHESGNTHDFTQVCAESGYKYGHAWLAERVPDEVWAEVGAWKATAGVLGGSY